MRNDGVHIFNSLMILTGACVVAAAIALEPASAYLTARAEAPMEAEAEILYDSTPAEVAEAYAAAGVYPANDGLDEELLASRRVLLTHDVNPVSARRIVASLLALEARDPRAPIDLYLRTNGGWKDDAFAIIDVMKRLRAPVNTIAIGSTESAGAMILAAGTGKRMASAHALIMVHDNIYDDEFPRSWNSRNNPRERTFWQAHAKFPEQWLAGSGEDLVYYLNPEEAVEMGIVDEVLPAGPGRTDLTSR